jgi:hypothetical protein
MKLLIVISIVVTGFTALAFWPRTCEEKGGHYEYLTTFDGSELKVCTYSEEITPE